MKVELFWGPHDGETVEVSGVKVVFPFVFPGPKGCLAPHFGRWVYEFDRLQDGRIIGVYAAEERGGYPCMA